MIDRSTIERIKDAADIVDVVSDFVSLKKVGSNYRGLCPFHNDHTPSFYVSPSRRTCKCFVCNEGGDSVGFIMKQEQLSYPDALRWLARRYNIEIQEKELTNEQKKEQTEREAMYIVNEWASKYFNDILLNDVDGRAIGMQYFRQRGVRDDIIEKFRLGFCLSDRHAMSSEAIKKGYLPEFLLKTGLCFENSNEKGPKLVDRFAGRVIFPWFGVNGKVTAFGGRVLDARTKGVNQKYVNSPDSEIYHKDHELYGIFQAKKAIARENLVYMVEGYTDVISMHQCGIENVVANSGTALSVHQIHILHRFTSNIVLLYDGDAAGIKAALKGTDMFLKEGMNVKVMLIPDGDDPDSFAKKHTAEEFRSIIKEQQSDFIAFKTRVLLDGVTDPRERSEAIASIIQSVSVIADPLIRTTYIQDCTARLGINEQTLTAKMNEFIRLSHEEERKERERKRRMEEHQQQDYTHTGQSPQTAKPATQQTQQQSYDDIPDFPPPDYDDEAFSNSNTTATNATPTTSVATTTPATVTPIITEPTPRRTMKVFETVEDVIMKMIIKHGDTVLYDDLETEDGETISLTIAQFMEYDLSQDSLTFSKPLYNQILAEAAERSNDSEFNSERYFTQHPDYEVSAFAIAITEDAELISDSMKIEPSIEQLRDQVTHLLLDFRNDYVSNRLNQLRAELGLAVNDPKKQMQLMTEMRETQRIRSAIAQKIGGSIR